MKKRKYIVIPRQKSAVLNGLETERGKRSFKGKSYLHVDDPGEARDIDLKYGKTGTQEVYVAEDEQYARALDGERWEVKSNLKETNVTTLHNWQFRGVDTSHFKVWVLKRGKLVRVTKEQAEKRGYRVVASTKKRPDISQFWNTEGAEVTYAT